MTSFPMPSNSANHILVASPSTVVRQRVLESLRSLRFMPGDPPQIFDAGFSTRAGSTGPGLSVRQRILAQHGGLIAVEGGPGQGATFRLRLPRDGTLPASNDERRFHESRPAQ